MTLTPDPDSKMRPYVRSDVSLAVAIALIAGVVFAVTYHWTFLTIIIAISYMGVGLSTVYEWNKTLVADGKAPQGVFGNVRTAAVVPIAVLVLSFHFQGHPFFLNGTVTLVLLLVYLYALYAVGFRGLDADEVYFEDDPYTGEPHVWDEATYIPLLEQWSVEQSEESD